MISQLESTTFVLELYVYGHIQRDDVPYNPCNRLIFDALDTLTLLLNAQHKYNDRCKYKY